MSKKKEDPHPDISWGDALRILETRCTEISNENGVIKALLRVLYGDWRHCAAEEGGELAEARKGLDAEVLKIINP